jgi:hypothetical protein
MFRAFFCSEWYLRILHRIVEFGGPILSSNCYKKNISFNKKKRNNRKGNQTFPFEWRGHGGEAMKRKCKLSSFQKSISLVAMIFLLISCAGPSVKRTEVDETIDLSGR